MIMLFWSVGAVTMLRLLGPRDWTLTHYKYSVCKLPFKTGRMTEIFIGVK